MTAEEVPLIIEQGATFTLPMQWLNKNDDGTPGLPVIQEPGWKGRMQIRKKQQTPALVSIDSEALGGITISETDGSILIKITDEQTDLLDTKSALYDLEVESPEGDVYRLIEGKVTVKPNITQDEGEPVVGA
jgi:hypothetical protein